MNYKIPLFELNFDSAEEQAALEVIRSGWISTGPKVAEFEEKFASMLGAGHAVALSNCTVALHLAMILCGVGRGDEVICPSLTFVATCNAIRYAGAIPVFADVKSLEDPTIDPGDINRKITGRTKAIVVMHYGGFSCDMDAIMAIASRHGLKVIEDACHGPMSEYKGRKLGTIGDIGCFSFFSNKNISTGEGGMLVTGNRLYFERAMLLRSHGMTSLSYERAKGHSTGYDVIDLGYNYRMDDIHAAIGLAQLGKLRSDLMRREEVRRLYLSLLKDIEGLVVPFREYTEFTSNYIFTVILNDSDFVRREAVRNRLAEAGIQTSVHYPAVHRFSIYREFTTLLPFSEYITDNIITLPMYSGLTEENIYFTVTELGKSL